MALPVPSAAAADCWGLSSTSRVPRVGVVKVEGAQGCSSVLLM